MDWLPEGEVQMTTLTYTFIGGPKDGHTFQISQPSLAGEVRAVIQLPDGRLDEVCYKINHQDRTLHYFPLKGDTKND